MDKDTRKNKTLKSFSKATLASSLFALLLSGCSSDNSHLTLYPIDNNSTIRDAQDIYEHIPKPNVPDYPSIEEQRASFSRFTNDTIKGIDSFKKDMKKKYSQSSKGKTYGKNRKSETYTIQRATSTLEENSPTYRYLIGE